MLSPVQSNQLQNCTGIRHGFFTRPGGASSGIYAALNCGYGSRDARDAVSENRRRVATWIGAAEPTLNTVHQVHGTTVADVRENFPEGQGPKADALVSATSGVALTILTADCAPVLFAEIDAGVIGAAHAGWRGALSGVTDATIDAMERLGAERNNIMAAIGPCIAQMSYEVGPEFKVAFLDADQGNGRYFKPSVRPGHWQFDLPGYLINRLAAAGIGNIDDLAFDTYGEPDRYFSYRRATHVGEADYGRAASVIMLA